MGGAQEVGAGGGKDQAVNRPLPCQVKRRRSPGDMTVLNLEVLASPEVVVSRSDQQDKSPSIWNPASRRLAVILDEPDHADHRCRVDRELTGTPSSWSLRDEETSPRAGRFRCKG